jgi:DNA-binding CsgD family transcriptional regulator
MEAMNKEIQMTALTLHEKVMVLDELKVYVTSLKKKGQETNQLRNAIAKKIDAVIITEQDKTSLQQKIDKGNKGFYKMLSERYPTLSTLEVQMCGLLKTGMTNKELSKLYGQNEKSHEQHRYRIKKKLGLTAKENLLKFLTAAV